MLKVIVAKISI